MIGFLACEIIKLCLKVKKNIKVLATHRICPKQPCRWLRVPTWGHVRQPARPFFCFDSRLLAPACEGHRQGRHSRNLRQHVSSPRRTQPVTYTAFFPFFFSVMGPVSGSYWQGDLTSPAKKVKIEFRYIYHLTISHLSLDRALSRVRHEAVCPLERLQRHVATPRRVPQVTPVRLHSRGPVCSALDAGGGSALPPAPGQGGTFSPPPETVMCERVAGLHRQEERVLPCPARQPLVTARSVRRRGARTRPFSRADFVSIVCQARRPVPSPAPVRPERRCSRQDLHWPGSVWNVLQAGILLFLGLDKLRFLLNLHSVRPHQFDRVLEFFASSTLVWKGGFLG